MAISATRCGRARPSRELLFARLPVTFELGFLALIIAVTIAVPIGVYSAIRQDTAGDYLFRSLSFLMLAVPAFWTGTMVMVLPSIWWGWSPEVKYVSVHREPAAEPQADADPGLHPRHGALRHHDAADAHADAGGAAAGLHPHRLGEGTQCPHRDGAPRAAQRAGPGRDAGRPAGAAADRRRRDRGADLRHSRAWDCCCSTP